MILQLVMVYYKKNYSTEKLIKILKFCYWFIQIDEKTLKKHATNLYYKLKDME
jgi:hypothetical protein